MKISELPSPLPIEIIDTTSLPVNLLGIPAELWVLTMVDTTTRKKRKGNGTFRIIDPYNGRLSYKWSEEDMQQTGSYDLSIGHDDGVAGPAIQYEFSIRPY